MMSKPLMSKTVLLNTTPESTRVVQHASKTTLQVIFYKNRYVVKRPGKAGFYEYFVFRKFENDQGKGLLYVVNDLKSLKQLGDLFQDELEHELVEDLHPDNSED
jgi:hypothetical protein